MLRKYKKGRLYEIKDGFLFGENGIKHGNGPLNETPFININEINKEMSPQFVEVVE